MARRVLSLLRRGPAALRSSDPVLEANAYALAVDVDLTVVLMDDGVELAAAGGRPGPRDLAGTALPPSAGGHDLQGLVESGVEVYASQEAVERRGIREGDLVPGIRLADRELLDELVSTAEAVLNW